MAIKSLAAVNKNQTIDTTKHIILFLNFSASHPDAVTEYRRIGIIIHIHLIVSYISEPEARSRAGGYFFLGPKSNTLIQEMYPENGPVHLECIIVINFME